MKYDVFVMSRKKIRNFKKIKKCKSLEKELSKYKLWANLVPESNFFQNLRGIFSQNEWDIIRKAAYKKHYHECSICGKENTRLEAHENWKYVYHQSIQKLISVDALCYLCHRNMHLGHSGILIREGKLNQEELISHWAKINNVNIKQFHGYQEKVFKLWNLKNKFTFKILDNKEININEGKSLSNVLKLIADDYEN